MKVDSLTPTAAVLAELGQRFAQIRKQRGLAQEALAAEAGVGVATVRRIEDGRDARLGSWLRLLQSLGLAAAIDQLLPENFRSPMAEAKAAARSRRGRPATGPDFVWGDEKR
ncbi:MAG: helix-turn-helix domain-containing protein [Planctomycetes bacterium]|nr:helix-turn-helix domain-containing protein [Planctomycetota bacterium]